MGSYILLFSHIYHSVLKLIAESYRVAIIGAAGRGTGYEIPFIEMEINQPVKKGIACISNI